VFGPIYVRASNKEDTTQILAQNAAKGFTRMFGEYELHALGLEKLPICLTGVVQSSF
jgi:hypothetical protein